ncbi:MAG: aldehyde dehydrogenase [Clostridia bacterium]|nr:aldehyde dehydrogenase [Clostridia bacterium]
MKDYTQLLQKQRDFFDTNATKSVAFRIDALKKIYNWTKNNVDKISQALKSDLNKSAFEAYATEIGIVLGEISHTLKHIKKWAKPKKVRTPLTSFKAKSYVYSEPYGVTLIMSPWNYPFQLAIVPLVASISAGNCAIVKPSAYSPATSQVIFDMASELFDESFVSVILGGRQENEGLLDQKFDYIFFTGGVQVGKTVMGAASKNLTPVTLELGGKSPCIIDKSADVKLSAKRLIWGKLINSGQTCIAPDYLYVHKDLKDSIVAEIKENIKQFYGDPLQNDSYPKMINQKHFDRVCGLIDDKVLLGGGFDKDKLKIEPTLLDATWQSKAMGEEIFGPVLPVIEFEDINSVIATIKSKPKPLALYLFAKDKQVQDKVLESISFGGGCVNDTIMHIATTNMPFGGVGNSGMGCYHGKYSFDTFSHKKSVLKKSLAIDIKLRYPPYKDDIGLLKKIQK